MNAMARRRLVRARYRQLRKPPFVVKISDEEIAELWKTANSFPTGLWAPIPDKSSAKCDVVFHTWWQGRLA